MIIEMSSAETDLFLSAHWLSWLSYSYKPVKYCLWVCVLMSAKVEQLVTAAHRDL